MDDWPPPPDPLGPLELPFASSEFYLHVASRALSDLQALGMDTMRYGGFVWGQEPLVNEPPSDHFRHAVVCTVFSAAAVEHALVSLALARRWLSRGPNRAEVEAVWPKGWLSASKLIEIASAFSKIDRALLERIKGLMKRRDRIVHSQGEGSETPIPEAPGEVERRVALPRITTDVLADAPGDVALADEAVKAIYAARGEKGWSPHG